jgi:hypothetical protein
VKGSDPHRLCGMRLRPALLPGKLFHSFSVLDPALTAADSMTTVILRLPVEPIKQNKKSGGYYYNIIRP